MTGEPFLAQGTDPALRQGDYLPGCLVSVFNAGLPAPGQALDAVVEEYDLVILTQSCDLEQRKIRLVATCPIYTLVDFEVVNPAFSRKGRWNEVLKGRVEGLHLLASPTCPRRQPRRSCR